jgi:IS30 family transposase
MAGIPGQKWTQGEKRSPGNMKAVNHELAAIPKRCLNFTSSYLAI